MGGEDVEHARAIEDREGHGQAQDGLRGRRPVPGPLSLVCLMALPSWTMIGLSRTEVVKEL
ncbi:MAG: hypothetical protein MZV63_13505 [Marinilabiliales bacterium]|nr:hypothetical protein [Marinilabiliales bacterium]